MGSKRKMNSLMIGQALLFSIVIIFFGIIVVKEKIPSLKVKNEKEALNNYYNENYKDLDFKCDEIKHNQNNGSYSITCYDKNYESLFFTITSSNNKITDNYKDNIIKGSEVIKKSTSLVLEKYEEVFKNTNYENIKIEFKDLNNYSSDEKVDILKGNIYNTDYYLVSYYVKVDSLDEYYLNNLINSFNGIANNSGLITNNYSVTFDNNGIIKIVKGGDFDE